MVRRSALILMLGFLPSCVIDPETRPATDWSATFKEIDVAANDIIRLVTPFPEPRIVTTSSAEIQRNRHVLYLLTDDDQPITMFVTDADNESASINLTLVPKPGGLREVDFAEMTKGAIRPASTTSTGKPKVVEEAKKKRQSLRRDPDDHGDNDNYGGDKSNAW